MAVTAHMYPLTLDKINKKLLDLSVTTAGSWYAMPLVNPAATWGATQENYEFLAAVTAAYTEVTGAGYTAGGLDISAGISVSRATGTAVDTWTTSTPISWATATISAQSMVIYTKLIGSAAASWPVVQIVDFGATVSSTAGTWSYTVAGTGLATWTAS